ncbi:MAG: DEAD/DEAH box helicase [Hamadaea sp.]|uniref:DEAD/DEAH box helicase n=1 Tax=Hamadaea sp. TaxID=2024425 RepID=UPI0017A4B49D|nr:DEAD/DEAH box helicase [Hamadaea sp.]NUR72444.1 DEAD/DEAH box helicase [Hamadaea sp.]NUT19969.1 DEAD/DEAH box helicase [Hamadaea sp.]
MAARRPSSTTSRPSTPSRVASPPGAQSSGAASKAEQPAGKAQSGFAQLGLPTALVAALSGQGITSPFPVQQLTIPDALAGRDVLGKGQTGSGKTYAFVLPMLARLAASGRPRRPGRPRGLILAPTRELADQIDASLAPLAKAMSLRTLVVYGGVGHGRQIKGLRDGVDVLVACPGRLADHIDAGHADLRDVEITVIDEADHMSDLGFLPGVRRLLEQTPAGGQRLLFSATLDAGVDVLVRRFLHQPVRHTVDAAQQVAPAMDHHVLHLEAQDRFSVLVDLTSAPGRSVVFTRTKYGAKALARKLVAAGVPAVELHGNLGQTARTRNLGAFSDGTVNTLVATDIAARGIHVDDVALVIHADPPLEHKAYLHRSGRTARAGAAGTVITLATDDQLGQVRDLTRKAGVKSTTTRIKAGHPLLAEIAPGDRSLAAPPPPAAATPAAPSSRGRRRRPARPAADSAGTRAGQPSAPSGAAAFSARTHGGSRRGRRRPAAGS